MERELGNEGQREEGKEVGRKEGKMRERREKVNKFGEIKNILILCCF